MNIVGKKVSIQWLLHSIYSTPHLRMTRPISVKTILSFNESIKILEMHNSRGKNESSNRYIARSHTLLQENLGSYPSLNVIFQPSRIAPGEATVPGHIFLVARISQNSPEFVCMSLRNDPQKRTSHILHSASLIRENSKEPIPVAAFNCVSAIYGSLGVKGQVEDPSCQLAAVGILRYLRPDLCRKDIEEKIKLYFPDRRGLTDHLTANNNHIGGLK